MLFLCNPLLYGAVNPNEATKSDISLVASNEASHFDAGGPSLQNCIRNTKSKDSDQSARLRRLI